MERTPPVKSAVAANEIVVACAYTGWIPEEVTAQLPADFNQRSYVAKFVNGELVALEPGYPEDVIAAMLGTAAGHDHKSCDDKACDETAGEAPAVETPRS